MITFVVYGTPAPKGSTKAFFRPGMKHPAITHDNAKTRPWEESVVSAARDALCGAAPITPPVSLMIQFFVPRPKSAPRSVTQPTKKPDLDKLVRCVLDGLTRAGVYRDDAQVVALAAMKRFATGVGDPLGSAGIPRAIVSVQAWSGATSGMRP